MTAFKPDKWEQFSDQDLVALYARKRGVDSPSWLGRSRGEVIGMIEERG